MRSAATIVLVAIAASGCSSTEVFKATGAYSVDDAGAAVHFVDTVSCEAGAEQDCRMFRFTWKTETFCGLYGGTPDRVTNLELRIVGETDAIQDWDTNGNSPVMLGDDEEFELASNDDPGDGEDLVCAVFDPEVDLQNISAGDTMALRVLCRPAMRGVSLMPPSDTPYRMTVELTDSDKVLFGCSR